MQQSRTDPRSGKLARSPDPVIRRCVHHAPRTRCTRIHKSSVIALNLVPPAPGERTTRILCMRFFISSHNPQTQHQHASYHRAVYLICLLFVNCHFSLKVSELLYCIAVYGCTIEIGQHFSLSIMAQKSMRRKQEEPFNSQLEAAQLKDRIQNAADSKFLILLSIFKINGLQCFWHPFLSLIKERTRY